MPWNNHVISGTGKPSAEHDKFNALPINSSALCGMVINRGATRLDICCYVIFLVIYKTHHI